MIDFNYDSADFFAMDMTEFLSLGEGDRKHRAKSLLKRLESDAGPFPAYLTGDLLAVCEAGSAEPGSLHISSAGLMELALSRLSSRDAVRACAHMADCPECREQYQLCEETLQPFIEEAYERVAEAALSAEDGAQSREVPWAASDPSCSKRKISLEMGGRAFAVSVEWDAAESAAILSLYSNSAKAAEQCELLVHVRWSKDPIRLTAANCERADYYAGVWAWTIRGPWSDRRLGDIIKVGAEMADAARGEP